VEGFEYAATGESVKATQASTQLRVLVANGGWRAMFSDWGFEAAMGM